MKTMTEKQWMDEFILELRLREVRGDAIGDAVASVRELVTDSGQDPLSAFGPPREYADGLELPRVSQAGRTSWNDILAPAIAVLAFLVYSPAVWAHFGGTGLGYSMPQLLLLLVPAFTVACLPLYFNRAVRNPWILMTVIGLSVAAAIAASFFAPVAGEAPWLEADALSVCLVAGLIMVATAIWGAISSLRMPDDPIVDPLQARKTGPKAARLAVAVIPSLMLPLAAVLTTLTAWLTA